MKPRVYGDGTPDNPFTFTPPPPVPWWRHKIPRPRRAHGGRIPNPFPDYGVHRRAIRSLYTLNVVVALLAGSAVGRLFSSSAGDTWGRAASIAMGAAVAGALVALVMARHRHNPDTCLRCHRFPLPARERTLAVAHWVSRRAWVITVGSVAGFVAVATAGVAARYSPWVPALTAGTVGWAAVMTRLVLLHGQHRDRCPHCQ